MNNLIKVRLVILQNITTQSEIAVNNNFEGGISQSEDTLLLSCSWHELHWLFC